MRDLSLHNSPWHEKNGMPSSTQIKKLCALWPVSSTYRMTNARSFSPVEAKPYWRTDSHGPRHISSGPVYWKPPDGAYIELRSGAGKSMDAVLIE